MFEVEVYGHHRRRLAAKAPAIMAECHLALAGIERVYKVSLAGHAADEQRVVVPMGSFGREGDSQTPRPVMEAVARTRSQRSRRGGHWNGLGDEAVKRHQRGARLASRAAGAGNGRRVYNTGGRTGENQVVVQAHLKTPSLVGPGAEAERPKSSSRRTSKRDRWSARAFTNQDPMVSRSRCGPLDGDGNGEPTRSGWPLVMRTKAILDSGRCLMTSMVLRRSGSEAEKKTSSLPGARARIA